MAEFSELIKNFDKIRDFMRDFYIYGFKTRNDFSVKSPRTYDNEKRRCESYLKDAMKWTYAGGNKISFVSADCGKILTNPLFSAWKSKSFTTNDIMLHFYILDALQTSLKSSEQLTEEISLKSGKTFDMQTVRGKCNEYADLSILTKEKNGKAFYYKLSEETVKFDEQTLRAIKFFESGTFGEIGSYILDNKDVSNDLFLFKHHYIAHTLEDGILCELLSAVRAKKRTVLTFVGSKSGKAVKNNVIPLKILCSFWSGRRYLCAYLPASRRFTSYRLDTVKSVSALETVPNYEELQNALDGNLDKVWGVSFDGQSRNETGFSMTLRIDETKEEHIINRINKEGRGGVLEKIDENIFRFSKDIFDANEAMPWVKTFIGRILSFQATDWLEKRLSEDIRRMAVLYGIEGGKLS